MNFFIETLENPKKQTPTLATACSNHMVQNNLCPDTPIIADGKIHRYSIDSKKNQPDEWYIAWEDTSDRGTPSLICVYGSWSDGSKYEFRSWENGNFESILDAHERKNLEDSHKKRILEIEKSLAEERNYATKIAKEIWGAASQKPTNKNHLRYLQKKGLQAIGIRFGKNLHGYDSIAIPLRNLEGEIKSLQYISVANDGKVFKSFLPGGEKKGNFCQLGPIIDGRPLYIVEGFATGASSMKQPNPV